MLSKIILLGIFAWLASPFPSRGCQRPVVPGFQHFSSFPHTQLMLDKCWLPHAYFSAPPSLPTIFTWDCDTSNSLPTEKPSAVQQPNTPLVHRELPSYPPCFSMSLISFSQVPCLSFRWTEAQMAPVSKPQVLRVTCSASLQGTRGERLASALHYAGTTPCAHLFYAVTPFLIKLSRFYKRRKRHFGTN